MPDNFRSVNPATEEVLAEFGTVTTEDAMKAASIAANAFSTWKDSSFADRSRILRAVAGLMKSEKQRLATVMTSEMGKPISEASSEIEKCAFGCEFFADTAESYLREEFIPSDSPNSSVVFEPLGVVLAIMPWNFPFWQVFRFGAPALMAGNVMLLKHAPSVPQCALEIEDLFRRAGLPDGVLTNLFIDTSSVEAVIADPGVRAVTLTGSDRAGSSVSSIAGKHLKKTVMELGGSDPFVVLRNANLNESVTTGVKARFQNTGQSCIAAKRFIVENAIADDYLKAFVKGVSELKVGDPMDTQTQIGPLARSDLRDNLIRQVDESVAMGARVEVGGKPLPGKGYFYEPTVLSNVTREMPVARQETFGPVAAFFAAADVEEAIDLANDTEFGLGGNVWTGDLELGRKVARRISSGGVFINGMTHSDPRLPFGGIKRSGWGRELSSFGIREFVNVKTLWEP